MIVLSGEMSQRMGGGGTQGNFEMEWGQVIKLEGRRGEKLTEELQRNHLGQHTKGEIESVKLSNCRIVLVLLRLFRYMTCHLSLRILHRADQGIESQDEIFKEEKGHILIVQICVIKKFLSKFYLLSLIILTDKFFEHLWLPFNHKGGHSP